MHELLQLSEGNEKDWFWFADKVLQCVAGRRGWGKEKTMKILSESVTVSDEAFALLILVNNWDKWMAEHNSLARKIDALYTSSTQGNKKFSGWSDAGIQKYNKLFDQIEKDRSSDQRREMEEKFLKSLQRTNGSNKRKSTEDVSQERIKARNTLFKKLSKVTLEAANEDHENRTHSPSGLPTFESDDYSSDDEEDDVGAHYEA
jgi:hypothetical protein